MSPFQEYLCQHALVKSHHNRLEIIFTTSKIESSQLSTTKNLPGEGGTLVGLRLNAADSIRNTPPKNDYGFESTGMPKKDDYGFASTGMPKKDDYGFASTGIYLYFRFSLIFLSEGCQS